MADFVAEIRPRTYLTESYVPTFSSDDFVAEIRPRRFNHSEFRLQNSQCHAEDVSDQDLTNILSRGHFSREDITRLLRGSIPRLVEKLLTGRSLSRIEGHLNVSLSSHDSPIVVSFNQTYSADPNSYNTIDQSLTESFNVKVKNGDLGLCPVTEESFGTTSPLHVFEREQCNSVVEAEDVSSLHSEYHTDDDGLAPSPSRGFHLNTAASSMIEETPVTEFIAQCPVPESKFENHRRHDSDDESGYTSNEKEDFDTPCQQSGCESSTTRSQKLCSTYNDYYCSGFDGKNTLYTPVDLQAPVTKSKSNNQYYSGSSKDGSDEMDDDDDDDISFNNRLVIDESLFLETRDKTTNDMCRAESRICREFGQSMDIDSEDVSNANQVNDGGAFKAVPCKELSQRCLNYETEDTDFPNSSDITDTDITVDFPGDSNLTLDVVSAISHPQSLVSKHPEGFKCKPCSLILENATAVTEHVQVRHDLHCCTVCCRTFTAKNNLKRHIRIHTGQRPYKCTHCSTSFARRDDLKDHMLRHEYSNPFRCSVCKRGYTDRACVKNHMAKEHGSRLMHVCPQCGESYDEEEAFAAHKRMHPELQQFSCGTCSFIGNNNQMIQKHSLLHTHKLFSCKPCNAYFADPFDYTNHIRKHKKTASFSQYVCCFCDLSLSTYYQYVRHEYSHAQGKTHSCKTCKKLFKNKSLLQDHAVIHQDLGLDEAPTTLQRCPDSPELNESDSMLWQPNEVQGSIFCSPSVESRFPVDNISDSSSPETSSSISQEENCDDFQGQLLDLSMKKPISPNSTSIQPRDNHNNISSRLREAELSEKDFRRNVVVLSESCSTNQGHKDNQRACQRISSGDCHEGRLNSMEDNVLDFSRAPEWDNIRSADGPTSPSSLSSSSSGRSSCLYLKPLLSARLKGDDWSRDSEDSPSFKPGRRLLDRSISQEYTQRASFRFSPYSRERFADLAAKFVAARGTKIFHPRTSPQTSIPPWETKQAAVDFRKVYEPTSQSSILATSRCKLTSTLKNTSGVNDNPLKLIRQPFIDRSLAPFRELKSINEVSREESNPETALNGHVLTLVKSEPVLENGLNTKDVIKGRLQSIRDECVRNSGCAVNGLNSQSSTPFVCEECKEGFGSFSELENHSVELHKRFLCEHCKKSFTARPNRDRHVRYHTGERPYKCDLCDLAFFRGDDLKYHRTTRHPTAQPFVCSRCDASFTWGRDLDRHVRHSKCKP